MASDHVPPARLPLYRLRGRDDDAKPWLDQNSILTLARDTEGFEVLAAPPPPGVGAVVVVRTGDMAAQVAQVLAEPTVRTHLAAGGALLIDDSNETGVSRLSWPRVRDAIAAGAPRGARIVVAQQNEIAPVGDSGDSGDTSVVVVHYWLHRFRAELAEVPPWPYNPRARFLCLNYKMRPHRAAVLGYLRAHGLLELGLVSSPEPDPAEAARWAAEWPAFADDIARVPPARPHIGEAPYVENPQRRLHAETGFAVVTETEMSDGDVLRFTEKTLKPLAAGAPFVVAGNFQTLALLRRYGFQTFAPEIDESYDLERDPQRRLAMVLAEVARLARLPEGEFAALRARVAPRLAHNAEHMLTGMPVIMRRQMRALRAALAGRGAR